MFVIGIALDIISSCRWIARRRDVRVGLPHDDSMHEIEHGIVSTISRTSSGVIKAKQNQDCA